MPREPKFVHPLRTVREAVNKSQPQFAKMFGVSASYIQAIELGQRKLSDELADAIMLRCGVDAESLKRKRGSPISLIDADKAEFLYGGDDIAEAVEDYGALLRVRDRHERLRRSVLFWKKNVLPRWELDHWRVRMVLDNKLDLLLEAAEREKKYHSVAMRLSRWIDNAVSEFRLRTTIDVICRNSRTGRDAQWPSFIETLSPSFRLLPRSRRSKTR
jgi:transcriptional regulator with XRE-family HTH domain